LNEFVGATSLSSQSNWEAVCTSCLEILKKSPDEGGVGFRELKKQFASGAAASEAAGPASAGQSGEAKSESADPLKLSKV
jgi:hypothetical protein